MPNTNTHIAAERQRNTNPEIYAQDHSSHLHCLSASQTPCFLPHPRPHPPTPHPHLSGHQNPVSWQQQSALVMRLMHHPSPHCPQTVSSPQTSLTSLLAGASRPHQCLPWSPAWTGPSASRPELWNRPVHHLGCPQWRLWCGEGRRWWRRSGWSCLLCWKPFPAPCWLSAHPSVSSWLLSSPPALSLGGRSPQTQTTQKPRCSVRSLCAPVGCGHLCSPSKESNKGHTHCSSSEQQLMLAKQLTLANKSWHWQDNSWHWQTRADTGKQQLTMAEQKNHRQIQGNEITFAPSISNAVIINGILLLSAWPRSPL